MDLYEFFQSDDLVQTKIPEFQQFYRFLKQKVLPWMAKTTGFELDSVSASLSMYCFADFLLPHDDLLTDRKIAFIYYLSPWSGAEEWTEKHGGALELFNSKENGPHLPAVKKLFPTNNRFVFFEVSDKSFHQVNEVQTIDFPRLTVNGWFHGSKYSKMESVTKNFQCNFIRPIDDFSLTMSEFIQPTYLKEDSMQNIQQQIESASEVSLRNFFKDSFFNELASTAKSSDDIWLPAGPINIQNYEVLDETKAPSVFKTLLQLLRSKAFLNLLHKYTELDLEQAESPNCHVEIQRWTKGCYTLLSNFNIDDEPSLDLILYLNSSRQAGRITYLADGDNQDSMSVDRDDNNAILTIYPEDNAMNIVYRNEGVTNFTKYVSHKNLTEPFYVISCKYKE